MNSHSRTETYESGTVWAVLDTLKAPLQAKWWQKITNEDLLEIKGNLATFIELVQRRYGELWKEVSTWANRRYSHWTGNYRGYKDPLSKS